MAYSTYDLAFLKDQLANKWAGAAFWTEEEAVIVINEALRVWNALTGFWTRDVEVETQMGALEYALPATITFSTGVEFNGFPLSKATMRAMDASRPSWPTELTTSGGSVPTTPRHWIPMSLGMIAIWPADGGSDNILTVSGVSATPVLENDADYLDIGDDALHAILGFALHIATLKEGGERFAATMPYYKAFLAAAAEQNMQIRFSQEYRKVVGVTVQTLPRPERSIVPDDSN